MVEGSGLGLGVGQPKNPEPYHQAAYLALNKLDVDWSGASAKNLAALEEWNLTADSLSP